ncbi:MAG: MazG family protein, partial [Candidatus Nanopelagicales bacterium]
MADSASSGGGIAPTGDALIELIGVMDRLRSPGGCPWDAKQTHESLVEYLIEETYETVEAIEDGDDSALVEELGDLLLQVVFHARIGQEAAQPWNIDDVARGIADKLIRRHDYVFGDAPMDDAAGSEQSWQAQKAAEKGRDSVLDGVPMAMPSLVLAAKLMRRADRGGVDVEPASASAMATADALVGEGGSEREFGELLLALIATG